MFCLNKRAQKTFFLYSEKAPGNYIQSSVHTSIRCTRRTRVTASPLVPLAVGPTRCSLAVGETVIALTPPSPSLLKNLLKGEGGAAEWQSRRRLVQPMYRSARGPSCSSAKWLAYSCSRDCSCKAMTLTLLIRKVVARHQLAARCQHRSWLRQRACVCNQMRINFAVVSQARPHKSVKTQSARMRVV